MSCEGTAIGAPFAGLRILWEASIKNLCFQYSCVSQRQMNSHLVTVEVGVKCGTYQMGEAE